MNRDAIGSTPEQVSVDLDAKFRAVLNDLFRYFDRLYLWNRKAEENREADGEEFIGQHPDVLRIVLEFDDVVVAVRGAHEMRLCAASHAL